MMLWYEQQTGCWKQQLEKEINAIDLFSFQKRVGKPKGQHHKQIFFLRCLIPRRCQLVVLPCSLFIKRILLTSLLTIKQWTSRQKVCMGLNLRKKLLSLQISSQNRKPTVNYSTSNQEKIWSHTAKRTNHQWNTDSIATQPAQAGNHLLVTSCWYSMSQKDHFLKWH